MRWPWLLVCMTGCDGVFGLGHLHSPPIDAPPIDAAVDTLDAYVCVSGTQHNEDGDFLTDDCDACPTVTSDDVDDDHDGLTNECDPNLSTSIDGDKILLASVFASTSELDTSYTQSGSTNALVVSDELVLENAANATTIMMMTPTMIVASITQFATVNNTPQVADKLTIGINGATCSVSTSGCGGEMSRICISSGPPTTHVALASNIDRVTLWQDSTGQHCEVHLKTAGGPFVNSTTGTITSSKGFVRVESSAAAKLKSLVFYGEK